jgi:hypothetical protein
LAPAPPQHPAGFCRIRFSSGIEISEIAVHIANGKAWAAPPSKPWVKDNSLVFDDDGKIKYQPLISFVSNEKRSHWSRTVIDAVRTAHPEVFSEISETVGAGR